LNQRQLKRSFFNKSIISGFAGALIWGGVGSLSYFFSFTEVSHASFLIRSFISDAWAQGVIGELVSLPILSIIGIIPAFIYYLFFKKAKGMLPSILFGVALWAIVFLLLQPLFQQVPAVTNMKVETIVTTLAHFILYGVFVGYTISYERTETMIALSKKSHNET